MTEMWYEIEHSRTGADDWFSTHDMAHTVERAQKLLAGYIAMRGDEDFQWRIVRKTVTTEVQVMSYDPSEYRRDDTRREQEESRETQGDDYTPAEMAQRMAIHALQLREQALPAILTGAGIADVFGLGPKS